jgi:hypothetical protein
MLSLMAAVFVAQLGAGSVARGDAFVAPSDAKCTVSNDNVNIKAADLPLKDQKFKEPMVEPTAGSECKTVTITDLLDLSPPVTVYFFEGDPFTTRVDDVITIANTPAPNQMVQLCFASDPFANDNITTDCPLVGNRLPIMLNETKDRTITEGFAALFLNGDPFGGVRVDFASDANSVKDVDSDTFSISKAPEPSTHLLLGVALVCLLAYGRLHRCTGRGRRSDYPA